MKCTFISGQYILNPENGELVFTSIALKSDTLEKLYEIKLKLQKSVIKSVGVKNTGSASENDAFCDILKLLQQTEKKHSRWLIRGQHRRDTEKVENQ